LENKKTLVDHARALPVMGGITDNRLRDVKIAGTR